jgi:hypothetical protein
MKQLRIRHQTSVADPLRQERLRRALAIIMDSQEDNHASCTLRQSIVSGNSSALLTEAIEIRTKRISGEVLLPQPGRE